MNPRESLNKILEASLKAGGITNPENITAPFAIGRWVPVEERLPVVDSSGKWAGYTKDLEGVIAFGYYDYHDLCVLYSAWLDLDMPNGKGEA